MWTAGADLWMSRKDSWSSASSRGYPDKNRYSETAGPSEEPERGLSAPRIERPRGTRTSCRREPAGSGNDRRTRADRGGSVQVAISRTSRESGKPLPAVSGADGARRTRTGDLLGSVHSLARGRTGLLQRFSGECLECRTIARNSTRPCRRSWARLTLLERHDEVSRAVDREPISQLE